MHLKPVNNNECNEAFTHPNVHILEKWKKSLTDDLKLPSTQIGIGLVQGQIQT